MKFVRSDLSAVDHPDGGFRIVEARNLSKLPDHFIVAEKIGKNVEGVDDDR